MIVRYLDYFVALARERYFARAAAAMPSLDRKRRPSLCLGHAGWLFLLFPVLSDVLVLVLIAYVYNNMTRQTSYPTY